MRTLTKEKKTIFGYLIIGTCFIVFSFLMISAVALNKKEYDPESFCPKDIEAHTIVLFDKSDSFSANQQKFILNYVNKEKDELRPFEKFSVFTLTENTYSNPAPLFSKCNPGSGEKANQLYQNPRKIQRRFDEFFSEPLKENMKNMLVNTTDAKSPILEMIRELSLRNDFGADVKKRTLIIISDLMHNTSEYSHYKNSIDYMYFSKKPYAYDVSAVLDSVNVKIIYLLRSNLHKIQGTRHMGFWENYFEETGASIVEVKRVK